MAEAASKEKGPHTEVRPKFREEKPEGLAARARHAGSNRRIKIIGGSSKNG
jgi:uncharacterized MAPEG superfamily protein